MTDSFPRRPTTLPLMVAQAALCQQPSPSTMESKLMLDVLELTRSVAALERGAHRVTALRGGRPGGQLGHESRRLHLTAKAHSSAMGDTISEPAARTGSQGQHDVQDQE